MCTRPITKIFPPSVHDRLLGIYSPRVLSLPCGKCAECLKKRQNDLSVRVYNEAKAKGSATFVTLTYAPKFVPVAQSMWCADRQTGEFVRFTDAELVPDVFRNGDSLEADILRGQIADYKTKGAPILEDKTSIFNLGKFGIKQVQEADFYRDWYIRYTPTLYYDDVQLALKRFRKNTGLSSKDFTYVAVGEYGANPESTQRPHYHLVFFGLSLEQVYKFADEWKYGFTSVKRVMFVNCDGSDGLARVSRYVGKYCSKGVFDAYTNKTGCTLKNRLRSSKGLGAFIPEHVKEHYLAFDVCRYDIDDPYKTIPKELLKKVIDTIIERQFVEINKCKYALSSTLRRRIFGYQRTDTEKFTRPKGFEGKCVEISEKAIYSPLYYMVTDELQRRAIEEDTREFQKCLVDASPKNISEAVAAFNARQEAANKDRDSACRSSILKFYQQHSKI